MSKLNPNEAPEGYVAKCSLSGKQTHCDKCSFNDDEHNDCLLPEAFGCCPDSRDDNCNVHFQRKPTRPTRKPREWMAWGFMCADGEFFNHKTRSEARRYHAEEIKKPGPVIRVKITEVLP